MEGLPSATKQHQQRGIVSLLKILSKSHSLDIRTSS
jgi:hypothetical protein